MNFKMTIKYSSTLRLFSLIILMKNSHQEVNVGRNRNSFENQKLFALKIIKIDYSLVFPKNHSSSLSVEIRNDTFAKTFETVNCKDRPESTLNIY